MAKRPPHDDDDAPTLRATTGELTVSLGPDASRERESGKTMDGLAPAARVGRYIVLSTLGEGGMGVVLLAYDPELDRKVAVKLWRSSGLEGGSNEEAQARLLREAQGMARLAHPNVVAVYDVGTWRDRVFMAMEYVEGVELGAWVKAGKRSWREILDLFLQAGRGLAAAHASGLLHRDFKPANVLVGKDGRARVCDFGLVKAAGDVVAQASPEGAAPIKAAGRGDLLSTPLTSDGGAPGTVPYMAPEALTGAPTDARADQFSFCVSLYRALWGERPFPGTEEVVLLAAIRKGEVRPPPQGARVPGWVRKAVLRGLAFDPAQRWPSMDAMLDALEAVPRQRRRLALGAAGLGALAAVGLAVGSSLHQRANVCARSAEAADAAWNPEVKRKAAAAFAALGPGFAAQALERTERTLDAWFEAWRVARREVCEASIVRKEIGDDVHAARLACLEQRLSGARGLSELLVSADQTVAARAPEAAASLLSVEGCRRLGASGRTARDEASRARALEIRRRLAQAEAQSLAGSDDKALASAGTAVGEARAAADPALLAECLLALGRVQHRAGHAPAARGSFDEALAVAQASGEDAIGAEAAIRRVMAGARILTAEESEREVLVARAAWSRIGEDERLGAQLLFAEAGVAYNLGRASEVVKLWGDYVERIRRLDGPDHPNTLEGLLWLSTAHYLAGEDEQAYQDALQVAEARARLLGPSHPATAYAFNDAAYYLLWAGGFLEASQLLDRSTDALRKAYPRGNMKLGLAESRLALRDHLSGAYASAAERTRLNEERLLSGGEKYAAAWARIVHAQARVGQGRFLQAEADARDALERIRALTGTANHFLGRFHDTLARALLGLGRAGEALAQAETAVGLYEQAKVPEHPEAVLPLLTAARARLALGETEAARATADRALAVARAKFRPQHPLLAEALEVKAATLRAEGRPAEALSACEEQLSLLRATFPNGHPAMVAGLEGAARSLHEQGDRKGARARLEEALELAEKLEVSPQQAASARLLFAEVLWKNQGDRRRAQALAVRARDGLAAAGEKELAKQAEAWLKAHR